ncbi:ExbD/TolR family protein [Roseivivax sp. CAU 1753]
MMRARLVPRRRRTARETVVPMINVVFLLLVFFLLTAQIAPAPPFDLTLPEASAEAAERSTGPLYVAADGRLALGDLRGAAALAAAAMAGAVHLEADAALPARDLARLLARLADAGATEITIATDAPPT